ncbi:MAG: MAPEG family protein [Rhodospirillales bacterium]|nr:MAG: MAPEG family protein [Rhodospirillales bacterium]
MSVALWCVLVAGLLPYAAVLIAKSGPGYDNADPRGWAAKQTDGFRRRALAAHLNGFEAFPLFAAAVLVAQQVGGAHPRVDQLAIAFIALRLVYLFCYVTDRPTPRSLAWSAGLFCVVGIFTSPVWR